MRPLRSGGEASTPGLGQDPCRHPQLYWNVQEAIVHSRAGVLTAEISRSVLLRISSSSAAIDARRIRLRSDHSQQQCTHPAKIAANVMAPSTSSATRVSSSRGADGGRELAGTQADSQTSTPVSALHCSAAVPTRCRRPASASASPAPGHSRRTSSHFAPAGIVDAEVMLTQAPPPLRLSVRMVPLADIRECCDITCQNAGAMLRVDLMVGRHNHVWQVNLVGAYPVGRKAGLAAQPR
jgi:hypothetical protein